MHIVLTYLDFEDCMISACRETSFSPISNRCLPKVSPDVLRVEKEQQLFHRIQQIRDLGELTLHFL